MRCTKGWRTTSALVKRVMPMPSTPSKTSRPCFKPEYTPRGKSTCVISPVITALEPKPMRVRKHLHLLFGGVLRLVQNHETVLACGHACSQRCDFDGVALDVARDFFKAEHFIQGVIKWAQIRVDFWARSPGKSPVFPRFYRRAHQ